jgi:hypothetical protein
METTQPKLGKMHFIIKIQNNQNGDITLNVCLRVSVLQA